MRAEGFRENGIYRLAGAGLLTGTALFGGERFLGVGPMDFWLAAEAAVILGLLAGIGFLPLRGKLLCLWAAVLGLGAAVWAAGADEAVLFLRSYFSWLVGTGSYPEWLRGYAFLQTGVLTLLCYLMQPVFEKIPRLKLIFTALLLSGALFVLLSGGQIPHLGMAFGVCFVMTVYAEQTEAHWKKVKSGNRKAYMLRIMPFLAVYLLLMAWMPAPEEPYDWPWVKNIYRQLRESFLVYTRKIKWGGREGFGMSFSGFSEDGKVGGDMQETAEPVMTVEPLNITPLNLYLTGTVYDTFDGRQWRQTYYGDEAGILLDTAETLAAAGAYGGQYWKDYLRSVKLRIRYQDFNTGYVFAPLKTWKLTGKDGSFEYTCEGGSLRFWENRGYGTVYDLEYYQMNAGKEAFYRFLEACSLGGEGLEEAEGKAGTVTSKGSAQKPGQAASEGSSQKWGQAASEGKTGTVTSEGSSQKPGQAASEGKTGTGTSEGSSQKPGQAASGEKQVTTGLGGQRAEGEVFQRGNLTDTAILVEIEKKYGKENAYTLEDVAAHRREIYENYLGGAALSAETADYLARITEGAETDVEKLRAIERSLSSLVYTLTPGELPGWVEDESSFLDFFLLESGEGYCTYFATAFVLLARAEGIPARYVQGYCVRAEDTGETAVYSNLAHAWPEAYIPGVGWIAFEPTPGYGGARYTSWKMQQPDAMTEAAAVDETPGIAGEATGEKEDSTEEPEGTEDASEYETEENEDRLGRFLKGTGSVFPVIAVGYVLLVLLDNVRGRRRLDRMCPEEIFKLEAGRNLKLLALLGLEREEWETLQELGVKCQTYEGMTETGTSGHFRFIEDYEDVVYGGRSAGREMIQNTVKERQELLELLKKNKRRAYIRWRVRAFLVRYR